MSDPYYTARYAWQNAERRCFEWFLEKLGAAENVQGYMAELPKTVPSITECNRWFFEMQGGGQVVRTQKRNLNAWRMSARIRGIFTERALAQQVAGLIRDYTPIIPSDAIQGVQELSVTGEPTLVREVMTLDNDLGQGGPIRVWLLEYPMECVFYNTEQLTS